jgi:hypothetical protein
MRAAANVFLRRKRPACPGVNEIREEALGRMA